MITMLRAVICGIALCLCGEGASAAELAVHSPQRIKGADAASDTTFYVTSKGGQVEIRIDLPGRKSVSARLNYDAESLRVRSVATGTDRTVPLAAGDLSRFKILRASLGHLEHRSGDALVSLVALLSEAPAGIVVDLDTERARERRGIENRAYAPLCEKRTATGRYDLDGTSYTDEVAGLGCYTSGNECLGRCGAGCGDNPFGNPAAVQRITQECLNHDLCAGAYGNSLGECQDEWNAAADGYLYAPDCASLTGTWRNGKGKVMRLTQDSEEVSGRISTASGSCRYEISAGDHTGKTFKLSAKRIESTPGCCPRLTYRGSVGRSCEKTRVEWTDSCNADGSISFARD